MESYLLENFDIRSKDSSTKALERFRNVVGFVKNRKRRFRFTANLTKRYEAEAMRRANQEMLRIAVLTSKAAMSTSSTPLLPETEINHEAHHIRNDSSQKDSTEEENNDDIHPIHGSPTDTEYFSCTDVDQRTSIRKKVKLEWFLLVANFSFELLTATFDQLSSPHKSHFALIATVTSFFTLGFCILEICYKCSQGKYVWTMKGKFYWFYNADGKPFGSILDIIGLVSGALQFILTAVACGMYYSRHVNSPINLHICSIVFAIGLLCSKIIVEKHKTRQHFESSES